MWYNGVVYKTIDHQFFIEGCPLASSERWSLGDARSYFKEMKYKASNGNFYGWRNVLYNDTDPLYQPFTVSTIPMNFYMRLP